MSFAIGRVVPIEEFTICGKTKKREFNRVVKKYDKLYISFMGRDNIKKALFVGVVVNNNIDNLTDVLRYNYDRVKIDMACEDLEDALELNYSFESYGVFQFN